MSSRSPSASSGGYSDDYEEASPTHKQRQENDDDEETHSTKSSQKSSRSSSSSSRASTAHDDERPKSPEKEKDEENDATANESYSSDDEADQKVSTDKKDEEKRPSVSSERSTPPPSSEEKAPHKTPSSASSSSLSDSDADEPVEKKKKPQVEEKDKEKPAPKSKPKRSNQRSNDSASYRKDTKSRESARSASTTKEPSSKKTNKKYTPTVPVDPLEKEPRKLTSTEIVLELEHVEDIEQIARSEILLEEDLLYGALESTAERSRRAKDRRSAIKARRQLEDETQVEATMARRKLFLERTEEKKRFDLYEQEELLLNALVRMLERDIHNDVFDDAYMEAQRVKYFNKTLAVILKNEASSRVQEMNKERYERLILIQRRDAAVSKQHISEKLAAFKKKQEDVQAAFHQTMSSQRSNNRRQTHALRKHRRSETEPPKKAKKKQLHTDRILLGPQNVKPRTDVTHNDDFWERSREAWEEREEAARYEILQMESQAFEAYRRLAQHLDEQRQLMEEAAELRNQKFGQRVAWRRTKECEKVEERERVVLLTEERASYLAIARHFDRHSIQEQRKDDAIQRRHLTHQRKIDDRQHRMLFKRAAFEGKQDLLMNDVKPSHAFLPVFVPKPPDVIAVVRDELELSEMRAKLKTNVALRGLHAQWQASRQEIEREERLERFSFTKSFDQEVKQTPDDKDTRVLNATQRRAKLAQQEEDRIVQKIAGSFDRSLTAQKNAETQKKIKEDMDKLNKDEIRSRHQVSVDERTARQEIRKQMDLVVGPRVLAAFQTVIDNEAKSRAEILASDKRIRQSLKASMASHKPQSRIVVVPPLPPPKSKFDIPGFLVKPPTESSMNRSRNNGSTSRGASKLSRSQSVASSVKSHQSARSQRSTRSNNKPAANERKEEKKEEKPEEEAEEDHQQPAEEKASDEEKSQQQDHEDRQSSAGSSPDAAQNKRSSGGSSAAHSKDGSSSAGGHSSQRRQSSPDASTSSSPSYSEDDADEEETA